MTIKVTVNLTQYTNPQRSRENMDRFVYFVQTVTNTISPAPGDKLSEADVKALIATRVTVNIKEAGK